MSDPLVGRLEQMPLREVWADEALSLTPWLLQNADVLADALGMDLELHEAEYAVGGFSLDLIGVDRMTGATVIVENQLEGSDHRHLGQLLTYAGGTDPTTIVWLAPRFRDEHRAALEWLNQHTDPGVRFFAVQLSAVRIGDSAPAPLLELAVQPNDWEKSVKASAMAASGTVWSWDTVLESIRVAEGSEVSEAVARFVRAHQNQGAGAEITFGRGASPSVNAVYRSGNALIRPWSIWQLEGRTLLSVNFAYMISVSEGPGPQTLNAFVEHVRELPAVGDRLDLAATAGWRKRPSLSVHGLLDDSVGFTTMVEAFARLFAACAEAPDDSTSAENCY